MANHLVFVYGSLKAGYGNHSLLAQSIFLGKYFTRDEHYVMADLGAFPGVLYKPHNGHQHGMIEGELYSVEDNTLKALDRLEGHPNFYKREEVYLEGYEKPVWMYILQTSYGWEKGVVEPVGWEGGIYYEW